MLTDLKEQNAATMYDMGLDISIDKVYRPDSISLKHAVVHFGGGCTGEIISAEGLVLTNHHCGYSYIQQHSSCLVYTSAAEQQAFSAFASTNSKIERR